MLPSIKYASLLFTAAVNAAPAIFQRDSIGPLTSTGNFTELELFVQFAGAAYCSAIAGNPAAVGNPIVCSTGGGSCPDVEGASTNVVASFAVGSTNTKGFVATDATHKLIVVSFQGTTASTNPEDILTDIDVIRYQTNLCGNANTNDGCQVHSGFYDAAVQSAPIVEAAVAAAVAKYPSYKIVVTGHSLGAAVATIMAVILRNSGLIVDLYNYGQPKLGTVDIVTYIQNSAPATGSNFRVTHWNDCVPQIPPHDLGDWDHFFPEYFIDIDTGTVAISDIEVVQATLYSTLGNDGMTTGLGVLVDIAVGITAHLNYFGAISACS